MQRQFTIHPSRYLAAALIAAHGVTLAALFPLALPVWAQASLGIMVLCSLGYHLRRDAWLSAPDSGVALLLDGDRVVLTTRSGQQVMAQVLRDSLVTPYSYCVTKLEA
ncbi:MAG: hypothetical protein HY306_09895 [Nitrosomonadales bacterium]|nr:hypothetical protein [Nitrosomonadales bacterium]